MCQCSDGSEAIDKLEAECNIEQDRDQRENDCIESVKSQLGADLRSDLVFLLNRKRVPGEMGR